MSKVVVGVDGGGTKTHCSVIDYETQTLLGTGISSCSNQNSVGKEKAHQAIDAAIKSALENAKVDVSNVVGICLGISGVDRPDDVNTVKEWVKQIFGESFDVEKSALVYNDGVTAIASGTKGSLEDAMVIISGTGSICIGSKNEKEFVRTGGWGPKIGDQGNAWSIGNKILGSVARSVDGVGPFTELADAVKQHLKLKDLTELIPYIYASQEWTRVADLAPLATQLFETDKVAKEIIKSEVQSLRDLACGAGAKMCWAKDKPFTLVFCGSVLTHKDSVVAEELTRTLKTCFDNVNIVYPQVEPSMGAAQLVSNYLKKQ
ncbi:N-acetyl-D-glucosamine kinase [Acrasis kona]|uniref:N-acetyl-D-glucosamine kinase n=1 Tax=Acrasis kona TaxID=1008807 RepID=A0AAW2ZM44_9EUKA